MYAGGVTYLVTLMSYYKHLLTYLNIWEDKIDVTIEMVDSFVRKKGTLKVEKCTRRLGTFRESGVEVDRSRL